MIVPAFILAVPQKSMSEDREIISWRTRKLSPVFYGEGAYFGDFNRDGAIDVVSGPFWYAGPEFSEKHEYRPAKEYDPRGYSDNFLTFVHDFNNDQWDDILIIGWPGFRKDHEHVWYETQKAKEGRGFGTMYSTKLITNRLLSETWSGTKALS